MFDLITGRKFLFQAAVGLHTNFNANDKFVYVDNQDDIINFHGTLWQIGKVENATNQIVKFLTESKALVYPNGQILQLLQYLIKFRDYGIIQKNKWSYTFLGFTDLSLSPSTRSSQVVSLLPHIRGHDQIWINDLFMEGSPTYFIELFDIKLWFAFFIVFAMIGLISTFGILLLKKFESNQIDNLNWFSILVNQGANENSTFISRRLLFISLALITIIFHGAFGAFMSSSLAIRHPDLPFSDITSLLNEPTYTVCTLPHTAAFEQVTHDAGKIRNSVKINSNECPNVFRDYDGSSNSIKNSEKSCPAKKMAYIGQGLCFFPEMTVNCPLSSIPGKIFNEYITIVRYAGFKYYEHFNQGILLLKSSGHLDYIEQKHDFKVLHGTCAKRFITPEPDIQVTLSQIQLLLVIMLLGVVCSMMLLLFELIYKAKLGCSRGRNWNLR